MFTSNTSLTSEYCKQAQCQGLPKLRWSTAVAEFWSGEWNLKVQDMKRDESQSDNLRHLKTVCLDGLPLTRLLLCCCWGLPSQSSGPQDKTNYIFTETDFLFHQDLLVLILVSYWKSQFFPLVTFDMSWVTRLIFPNKSFIKLANWFVPCQSEKKGLKIQKEDLPRASKSCTVFFKIATNWFVLWISMYAPYYYHRQVI